MDTVTELEHYLQRHELDTLVKEMMIQCLKEKPEEPLTYLLKWILTKNVEVGKSTEEAAVASTSDNLHVVISHQEHATQQWITDKKLHLVFLELLKQVLAEKPDNVLSFLALAAHNLHKSPPPSLAPQ